jgi:hypothetical protein
MPSPPKPRPKNGNFSIMKSIIYLFYSVFCLNVVAQREPSIPVLHCSLLRAYKFYLKKLGRREKGKLQAKNPKDVAL